MILIRSIFFTVLMLILIPFLLKKNFESLKLMNLIFVITLGLLVLDIIVEAKFFRDSYINEHNPTLPYYFEWIKKLDMNIFNVIFTINGGFYSQPFILGIKG